MGNWAWGLAGFTIAAFGAWQGDDLATAVADLGERVTAIEERLAARPISTVEASGAIRIEGDGRVVSEPFRLEEGTTLFTTSLEGADFAQIELLPAPGTGVGEPIYVSGGDSQGTNATVIREAGDFVLAGDGNGTWAVVIEQ